MQRVAGRACLTFTRHVPDFSEYENALFVGNVESSGSVTAFTVERALPTISLVGSRWRRIRDFASSQPLVGKRVRSEAARRGQPPPKVRIPLYR